MHGVIPQTGSVACAGRAVLLIQFPDAQTSRSGHNQILDRHTHAWREIQKMDVRRPPSMDLWPNTHLDEAARTQTAAKRTTCIRLQSQINSCSRKI
jgi:hypothetical protein